ncbi:sensor histidine kinase [Halonotius sp. GCM10025705]|uniref:sensor histidine kinase n=1 Tax=Halonotius sp. GCM10025705 TaxID=3252678 RepID=UPI0036208416
MNTLIDDILTLAQAGSVIDERTPLDIAVVAQAAWETVETPDSTLVVETDRTIRADETRLQQLFANLFRNAIEHGGRDVAIRIGSLDDHGFYVEDDGPGIPAADREAVLESGYTTSDDGTGFGLAIVAEVADAHGWEVTVTEGADGGARFECTGV